MKTYYKGETAKAINNFTTTGTPVSLNLIYAVAIVKKAAAEGNFKIKRLPENKFKAIEKAVDRILTGEFDDQFVTDQVQGGAGTSTNMNVNEVISSIAEEILGDGTIVHPNDDVNMGQSTNDSIPTAIKVMMARHMDKLIEAMTILAKTFRSKSKEYENIVKVGRTHLQDAVPITLGQSFGAYASFVERNIERLNENKKYIYTTNFGGTAIGSAINSSKSYIKYANEALAKLTGYPFVAADDLFDATQNSDNFAHIAGLLKVFAGGLSKIVGDLRMLASGPRAGLGEIFLPELQKGSSIMPGKVNPVMLEMINQICYQVYGNVETMFHVAINSQFELNVMLPIYAKNINETFIILTEGIKSLEEKVIRGIEPNIKKINELFNNSLCMSTALNRYVGYDKAAELVKKAIKNNTGFIEELKEENLLDDEEIAKILNPKALTEATDEH